MVFSRFMGAVTALLVLAALLSSIDDQLPKTAYFKFVDLWFNWFIANIFLIILIHIFIDYCNRRDKSNYEQEGNSPNTKFKVSQVSSTPTIFNKLSNDSQTEEIHRTGSILNSFFKLVIFIFTLIFLAVYFAFTRNK